MAPGVKVKAGTLRYNVSSFPLTTTTSEDHQPEMTGTSQAAPIIAGSIGILRAIKPDDSILDTVARLVNNGISVTDNRDAVTTEILCVDVREPGMHNHKRLDLDASIKDALSSSQHVTLDVAFSPSVVGKGEKTSIYWTSTGADYCTLVGDDSTDYPTSGSNEMRTPNR